MNEHASTWILNMPQNMVLTDASQLLVKKVCRGKDNTDSEIETSILSNSQALITIDVKFFFELLA